MYEQWPCLSDCRFPTHPRVEDDEVVEVLRALRLRGRMTVLGVRQQCAYADRWQASSLMNAVSKVLLYDMN
jgi:hypothetical protein